MTLPRYTLIGISLALGITLLVLGKALFMPLAFAILFALALSPLASFFDRKGVHHMLSCILTILSVLIVFSGLVALVSWFFSDIYGELPNIEKRISQGVEKLIERFTTFSGLSMEWVEDNLKSNSGDIISPAWSFIRDSITLSLITLGNAFLVLFYTFLLLYYRKGIKRILVEGGAKSTRSSRRQLLSDIRDTTRHYFTGIFLVMLILGVLNSTGLWLIGIDYAIFWGFLAAFLVIIPYIGTTLGGIFPFLYALATTDTTWQPAAIVIMYYAIQQLEGNFITPKVVGSEIDLNILTILLAMISGALIWGIPGIILAPPVAGVIQVIFSHHEETLSLGKLMSSKLYRLHKEEP